MSRYLTELTGTFFLVFTIGMVVVAGTPAAPIAIGVSDTSVVGRFAARAASIAAGSTILDPPTSWRNWTG